MLFSYKTLMPDLTLQGMEMDVSQYKELFLKEGRSQLDTIDRALLSLDDNFDDPSYIDELFRCFHSIKGMAATMGYGELSTYSHLLEDLLDEVKQGGIKSSREILHVLSGGRDEIERVLTMVERGETINLDVERLREEIDSLRAGIKPDDKGGKSETTVKEIVKIPEVVKIHTKDIDILINLMGELITSKSRLFEMANSGLSFIMEEEIYFMDSLLKELNKKLLDIRLLSFKDVVYGLKRYVNDFSGSKDVELLIEGDEVELDRVVLEKFLEPLIHIVRNAIDHGIEDVEERKAKMKPEKGVVKISLMKRHGEVIISVRDDGRGIDPVKVKEKAVALGLIRSEDALALSDEDSLYLTCLPGFTLSESVSETSGRGVGMDAVRTTIEGLGGRLKIESNPGKGTKVICFLPALTAIVKVLLISISNETYALPIFKVRKVLDTQDVVVKEGNNGCCVLIEGVEIPIIKMRDIFPLSFSDGGIRDSSFVLCDIGEGVCAILVDSVLGDMEAYIRDLPPPLNRINGISAYTFIKGERPIFLLEPSLFIQEMRDLKDNDSIYRQVENEH